MMDVSEARAYLTLKDQRMPVFIILGADPLAAVTILRWCLDAHDNGVNLEKIKDARHVADACASYQPKKLPD